MLKDLDITPDDPTELRAVNRLLADEVKSQALLIEKLKHQLAGQNRHRFGVRSESLDQLNLTFEEDEAIAEAASAQHPETPSAEDKSTRQHSRKPLPDHLDRHDEVLSPGEDCSRCGGNAARPQKSNWHGKSKRPSKMPRRNRKPTRLVLVLAAILPRSEPD